jgi:hypothetical protein
MAAPQVIQGREVTAETLAEIRQVLATHPTWSRRQLSQHLATRWQWRTATGQLKDMAARTLLGKLEARGLITLPARRRPACNRMAARPTGPRLFDTPAPITAPLAALQPLAITEVSTDRAARRALRAWLAAEHYLGYRGSVGETLQYVVRDRAGRLLAGVVWGAPAWSCQPRDRFIGWSAAARARHLGLITNNTRFLIPATVRVPHLASWTLGQVTRRLSADWQRKYGHPILLVETFVDRARFRGTSYRAANWIHVGLTTGRSRQDRTRTLQVPIKDVYLAPLDAAFRARLTV